MSDTEREKPAGEGGEISGYESPSEEVFDDHFNLLFSVAVVETEATEIDNEFIDAVTEIEGKKSFPCDKCDKVCKSKGGLTRHTNSKHVRQENVAECPEESSTIESPDEDTVYGFVEAIKARIIDEDLYGSDTNKLLATVTSTKALFEAVLPMYKTFARKKNQDKLLESFYGLIPRSCELLKCKDYKIANLVMIQLPDFLVGFYNRTHMEKNDQAQGQEEEKIDPAERGPLSYIAGYIVSRLHLKNRKKKEKSNEEIQALLQAMKSSETASQEFISARSRGGLVSPSADLVGILEISELSFRSELTKTKETLRSIPTDVICNTVLNSPAVKSLWENIILASGIELSSPTQKLCLENVVKLYLKVRSFSYARDFITKYKIKKKQTSTKALRKELKKSEEK